MSKKSKKVLKSKKTFSGMQIMLFVLAFAAVGAVAVWQSLAAPHNGGGKPKPGGGTGTISLVMVSDANSDGSPNFGDKVTFNVSTPSTIYPWVTLKCYVNGALVMQTSNGIFATSLGQNFNLGPTPSWPSGPADCTATLQNWDNYSKRGSITDITSMSFRVNA
jgi:hypothetical protein